MIKNSLLSVWSLEGGGHGIGNAELLTEPLTAFFASRQCPGVAIRTAMDWAVEQARSKNPVISGFHSPLEQSVLEVMLTAGAPCVIVIARKFDQAHMPSGWLRAAVAGNVAVVGMDGTTRQLSAEMAERRNEWVARHAARIVIAHASVGGSLRRQAEKWERDGRSVIHLFHGLKDVSGPL